MNRFAVIPCVLLIASLANAEVGNPLAVRCWPAQVVSIETHWGLCLVVANEEVVPVDVGRPIDRMISPSDVWHHVLSRKPLMSVPTWTPQATSEAIDANRLLVQSNGQGVVMLTVDGIHIAVAAANAACEIPQKLPSVDVLVWGRPLTTDGDSVEARWVREVKPKFVLLDISAKSDDDHLAKFQRAIEADSAIVHLEHNTFAISAAKLPTKLRQVVLLHEVPWQMPAELSQEFDAMDKACHDAQEVFRKLTSDQLNFRPANGTHTPRWNAEHMMGRQLLFFSQIYHQLNASIPVMDLNPDQMPPDYEAAHPNWDGAEEARQMQRVSDFCHRFAYLLDSQPLDEKAPGSRWPTLRALLVQMQRHYGEHTANTVKKFSLPDWPRVRPEAGALLSDTARVSMKRSVASWFTPPAASSA